MNTQKARELLDKWLAEDIPDEQSETLRTLLAAWEEESQYDEIDAIGSHMDDCIALGVRARKLRDIITARLKEDTDGTANTRKRTKEKYWPLIDISLRLDDDGYWIAFAGSVESEPYLTAESACSRLIDMLNLHDMKSAIALFDKSGAHHGT